MWAIHAFDQIYWKLIPMKNTQKKTLFFTMVKHPLKGWIRAGNAYFSRGSAQEWLPFVKGRWRYCKVKVSQCTITLMNGVPTDKSRKILSEKFNLES